MSRKEKLKELLVDEDEAFDQLIEEAKQLIGINMTDHQAILLYLLSAKFSLGLELREYPEVNNQELAEFLNRDPNAISSRISELKKEKKVTSPDRGKHTVRPLGIRKDIDEILQRVKNLLE